VVGRQIEIYDEIPVPGAPSATNPFGGRTYSQILAALGQDASVLNNFPDYKRSSNGDFSNNDTDEYAFTIDWRLGDHTLTAITGYSKYEFEELCDCDFTGAMSSTWRWPKSSTRPARKSGSPRQPAAPWSTSSAATTRSRTWLSPTPSCCRPTACSCRC